MKSKLNTPASAPTETEESNIVFNTRQLQRNHSISDEISQSDAVKANSNSIADIPVKLQVFSKNGPITKSISVDDNGNIVKDSSQCWISQGKVETITVTPKDLPRFLDTIEHNQALGLSNIDYFDGRDITTKGNEHDDVISRTSKYFPFVEGPAFILFDVDTSDEYNPENLEQVLSDMARFIPEFAQAAKIIKPSTSSNIRIKEVDDE